MWAKAVSESGSELSGGSDPLPTRLEHGRRNDDKRGQSDRCERQEGRAVTSFDDDQARYDVAQRPANP